MKKVPNHKGVDTASGRLDSYTDRNGNANHVQSGKSGGHSHSVPATGHFDITRSDGSKADISSGKSGSGKSGGSGSGSGGGSGGGK